MITVWYSNENLIYYQLYVFTNVEITIVKKYDDGKIFLHGFPFFYFITVWIFHLHSSFILHKVNLRLNKPKRVRSTAFQENLDSRLNVCNSGGKNSKSGKVIEIYA